MLLRRVIEHVKAQHWTAVALDFVIVVMGVFIGIQVANWNEARSDRQREEQILRDIAADLRLDREEFATGREIAFLQIAAANYALTAAGLAPVSSIDMPSVDAPSISGSGNVAAPDLSPPPISARDRLWSSSIVSYYPTPSTAAFDALLSSGELGLISDEALVRELQFYKQLLVGFGKSQITTFRPLRNDAIAIGQSFGLSAFGSVEEENFVRLVESKPSLAAALRTQAEMTLLQSVLIDTTDARAEALLRRLEDEKD